MPAVAMPPQRTRGADSGPTGRLGYVRRVVQIHFLPSEKSISVPEGTTLLEAARRAGLPIASACSAGGLCARCGLEIVEGLDSLADESPEEREAKRRNRVDPRLRLACRVGATHGLVVTASYW
jgi:ferredoxin